MRFRCRCQSSWRKAAIFVVGAGYDELKAVFERLAVGADKQWFQELHDLSIGTYGQFYHKYGVQWIFLKRHSLSSEIVAARSGKSTHVQDSRKDRALRCLQLQHRSHAIMWVGVRVGVNGNYSSTVFEDRWGLSTYVRQYFSLRRFRRLPSSVSAAMHRYTLWMLYDKLNCSRPCPLA